MKTVNIVNIVPTQQVIQSYFPGSRTGSRVARANIPLRESPRTAFGRWLAENIPTTSFDDDMSLIFIQLPFTEHDLEFHEFARHLQLTCTRSVEEAKTRFSGIERWLARQRKLLAMYGNSLHRYHTVQFRLFSRICGRSLARVVRQVYDRA